MVLPACSIPTVRNSWILIIAMTANAFSEDVQNCLNAGMDAHISKSLDIGVLERTLKSVAGGKAAWGGQAVHR